MAPSHAAAVMSGAMIKMGIYGLLRAFILLRSARSNWNPGVGGANY